MPTTKDLRGSVAIVGVGLAGCGEAPGWNENEIMAAAARNALADAGMSTRDVDGLVCASVNSFLTGLSVAEQLVKERLGAGEVDFLNEVSADVPARRL